MRKFKLIFLFLVIFSLTGFAQKGVIYQFSFRIDPDLTQYLSVENTSRNFLKGFSVEDDIPEDVMNSIKETAIQNFSTKFKKPISLCYYKNSKGKEIGGPGVEGFLEGLPENSFKRAKNDCPGSSIFIKLNVNISKDGESNIQGLRNNKIKPKIEVEALVSDESKGEIWKNRTSIKNFGELRFSKQYEGSVVRRDAETLTPYDIYVMYVTALEKLMEKE